MDLPRPRRSGLSPREVWAWEAAAARRRKWEDRLNLHIRTWGLPPPEREYRFHPTRRWRFDRAWPEFKLAVEIEGVIGAGRGGRHQRPVGMARDAEKYNAAQLAGWTVLRFTPAQIKAGYAIREVECALHRAAFIGGEP
jgi:very-short-patch-repair endonuclease